MNSEQNIIQYINACKKGTEGYKFLYDSLKDSITHNNPNPLFIGKIGANELIIIYQAILIQQGQIADFSMDMKRDGSDVAGIHPNTKEGFMNFVRIYLEAIKSMNIIASWNERLINVEEYIWRNYIVNSKQSLANVANSGLINETLGIVELTTLESFYTERQYWWQNLYENKTILVITPFTKSIQKQLDNRENVFRGKWKGFWSDKISFKFIKFPHPYNVSSKEDKVKYPESNAELLLKFQKEIDEVYNSVGSFDIALIGAGGNSILLCDYIKRVKGKSAFHLGGGLQMMFGVYGNRWDPKFNNSQFLKEYINDSWIRPIPEEVPPEYKKQENGAYF